MSIGLDDARSSLSRRLLNLAAVAIVALWLFLPGGVRPDALAVIFSVIALLGWAGWAMVAEGRVRAALLAISALTGAVAVDGTDALMIAAVVASIIGFIAIPTRHPLSMIALVAAVAVVLGVGGMIGQRGLPYLLSVYGGLLLAVLVGITRRQSRLAQARDQELLARSLEAERESARAALLAERTAVARDIHDVLAHSLGGLVIQLDAVEALLEAGRTTEATERVIQAHALAVDGLTDARRAVSALRDDTSTGSAPDLDLDLDSDDGTRAEHLPADTALADLVTTHRSLGFRTEIDGDLGLTGITPAHRAALTRALQEALSNARRHAPTSSTHIRSERTERMLTVMISTSQDGPSGTAPPAASTGLGLAGMRERFADLGDASTVTAGPADGRFVVTATVPVSGAR